MDKIVDLFPNNERAKKETPKHLFERIIPEVQQSNRALVLLIDDRAGVWKIMHHTANLSNAETMMAIELIKDLILATTKGE